VAGPLTVKAYPAPGARDAAAHDDHVELAGRRRHVGQAQQAAAPGVHELLVDDPSAQVAERFGLDQDLGRPRGARRQRPRGQREGDPCASWHVLPKMGPPPGPHYRLPRRPMPAPDDIDRALIPRRRRT